VRFIIRGSRFQLDLELGRIPQQVDEPDAPTIYDMSGAHLERAPAYDYEEPASVGRLGFQPNNRESV
jgi:hypothetical protein